VAKLSAIRDGDQKTLDIYKISCLDDSGVQANRTVTAGKNMTIRINKPTVRELGRCKVEGSKDDDRQNSVGMTRL